MSKSFKSFFRDYPVAIGAAVFTVLCILSYIYVTNHSVGGTCTYEGLECPTALNQWQTDSMAYSQLSISYDDCEETCDSLADRCLELETKLAGFELKNHSHLPKR